MMDAGKKGMECRTDQDLHHLIPVYGSSGERSARTIGSGDDIGVISRGWNLKELQQIALRTINMKIRRTLGFSGQIHWQRSQLYWQCSQ
ncbi:hypothetical protein KIN20_024016 [Parelaphostrongylus tenuis]|uniref:Uncharacterized protein n=1 Tax=Parelaphostrongylus tenuis TaxID=148309 RepID=A0AAD5QVP5_PARTN|nr:hypothetical protein KIN20_024016 [Parelaphostrongylus tenuis]